jgi:phage major head subunit gpT-like protein
MTMTRSGFLNLLVEGLSKVFYDQYKDYPAKYKEVYRVEKSSKYKETLHSVAPLGAFAQKAEGTSIEYADMSDGYEKDFTHTAWARGLRFTRELVDDELYGVMRDRTKQLARAGMITQETQHAKLFNYATVNTYFAGQDGLSLLNDSHTYADNTGTWDNYSASTDLSLSALETAFNAMRRYKDDKGNLIMVEPKYLLIPPELEFDAYEILNSSGKPYTADNESNYFKGRLEVITWPYLSVDTGIWFVLSDDKSIWPVSYQRVPMEFKNDSDFDTMDLKVSAYCRFSNGFFDPRFCYGGT